MPALKPMPQDRGFAMLEVLASLLLFSFSLLGMTAILGFATTVTASSGYRTVAVSLAVEAVELARANPEGFSLGYYDTQNFLTDAPASTGASPCSYPRCDVRQLAQTDMLTFKARVRALLPSGGFQLERPTASGIASGIASTSEADVWIVWMEPRMFRGGTGAPAEKEFDNCPAAARQLDPMPRCIYLHMVL